MGVQRIAIIGTAGIGMALAAALSAADEGIEVVTVDQHSDWPSDTEYMAVHDLHVSHRLDMLDMTAFLIPEIEYEYCEQPRDATLRTCKYRLTANRLRALNYSEG